MFKKLPILLAFIFLFNIPLSAQNAHFELSYQSFQPFIHFQIDINNYNRSYSAYESAYMTGYMDGVNDSYYTGNRIREIAAYRAGYRDGLRDGQLLIRLRGRRWYKRNRFTYDDYYAPTYAVQIWLEGLSLAFLQAPARRLPPRWHHRAHPHLRKYRKWMSRRGHHKKFDTYYSANNVKRRYSKRIRSYRKKLNRAKKRNHGRYSKRNRGPKKRFNSKRNRNHKFKGRVNRISGQRKSEVHRAKKRRKKVRKQRKRNAGRREKIHKKRKRGHKKSKGKSRNGHRRSRGHERK